MARFSTRIHWSLEPNRLAAATSAHSGTLLDLTQSNPTAAGIVYPEDLLDALTDSRALRYDPAPAGIATAREAVSGYYGGTVDPGRIMLTASTSEAYAHIFKLLCDPGDEVLVPRPSYPLFDFLADLEGVRAVQYPLHYTHGWYIDLDALSSAVTDRTRAIVFVNPNNPTGTFLKLQQYEVMSTLCGRYDMALIVDEVFADYPLGPDPLRVPTVSGKNDVLTFTLSGLSKVAGLPQMKLGWIVTGGPQADCEEALKRLELIADTFLSTGTPVQYALPRFLEARTGIRQQISDRTRSNLDLLRTLTSNSPAQLLEPEGSWYATLRVPNTRTGEEWVLRLINEQDVLVQPGFFYDFESEAFLILSLLTERDTFAEGAKRTILALNQP